jgi:hypothetical protein
MALGVITLKMNSPPIVIGEGKMGNPRVKNLNPRHGSPTTTAPLLERGNGCRFFSPEGLKV